MSNEGSTKHITALVFFVTFTTGLVGIAVRFFSPGDGWMAQFFKTGISGGYLLLGFAVICMIAVALKVWNEGSLRGTGMHSAIGAAGNLVLYGIAGIGAYFIYRLATTGSF